GGSRTQAIDINDAGQMVGVGGFSSAALFWPSAYDAPIALPGGNSAQSINASGQVAGFALGFVGRLWENPYAPPQVLSPLPGGTTSLPLAINGAGQMVGIGTVNGWQTA